MYLNADGSIARRTKGLTPDDSAELPFVEDRRMQRIRCYLTLALADLVALVVSFVMANTIYLRQPAADHGFTLLLVMVPIYFCFAAINTSYGGDALMRQEKSFTRSAQAVLFAGTAVALIVFLMKAGNEVSRAVFVIGWLLALIGVPMLRLAIARPLLNRTGGTPYSRVVIVDLGNACWTYKHFSQDIQTRQYWRKGVLEQFDWDEWKTQPPMCGAGLVLRERLAPPFAGACRKLESY